MTAGKPLLAVEAGGAGAHPAAGQAGEVPGARELRQATAAAEQAGGISQARTATMIRSNGP